MDERLNLVGSAKSFATVLKKPIKGLILFCNVANYSVKTN